jgi:hypothetical protein
MGGWFGAPEERSSPHRACPADLSSPQLSLHEHEKQSLSILNTIPMLESVIIRFDCGFGDSNDSASA